MRKLEIDDIRIQLLEKPSKDDILGYCSFVVNKAIKLTGVAIRINSEGTGLRLSYPSVKKGDRQYWWTYPINRAVSDQIVKAVEAKLKVADNGVNS